MMILMKVSDISNEARPIDVAMPWLDCLLQEFFNQVLIDVLFMWAGSQLVTILNIANIRSVQTSELLVKYQLTLSSPNCKYALLIESVSSHDSAS